MAKIGRPSRKHKVAIVSAQVSVQAHAFLVQYGNGSASKAIQCLIDDKRAEILSAETGNSVEDCRIRLGEGEWR